MDVQVKAAIFTVIGTVVGAVIVGVTMFSYQARTEKRIEQAIAAYGDYLKAVGRCVIAQRSGPGFDQSAARRAIEEETAAKGAIAIYGDAKVVEAVAAFVGDPTDPDDKDRLLKAIEAMRQHVGAEQALRDDVQRLLFHW